MSRSTATATRPQLALQSYLDGLLQDAAIELEQTLEHSTLDEFEAAVLEEQVRDAQLAPRTEAPALALVPPATAEVASEPRVEVVETVAEVVAPVVVEPIAMPPVVEPVADVHRPAPQLFLTQPDGRPDWAEEPFECLLFDVAGLTLAVPLVCLGSIYPLAGQDLTPLFGQPDWFLGILPSQSGNLKVLDTARWVMPDRYRDDFKQGLQYVISVQGYEWGLAVHQVSRSIRLNPDEIKWRSQRAQRPWLAGTVIEHMCALLDVAALAELIASGGAKRMHNGQIH
ncbi:chemotaxis protein CheW [Pseudomonas fulva]|uniref:CheW domain-containing protein n=1 Tax=Pseudomonas fulva TaxID=47880 RepID=UPI00201D2EF8|nr:CheW domain-containing protein [Pseudomonas fulva]UQY34372.1 chemotaxis protein CheW [Pseudomonas fulva]